MCSASRLPCFGRLVAGRRACFQSRRRTLDLCHLANHTGSGNNTSSRGGSEWRAPFRREERPVRSVDRRRGRFRARCARHRLFPPERDHCCVAIRLRQPLHRHQGPRRGARWRRSRSATRPRRRVRQPRPGAGRRRNPMLSSPGRKRSATCFRATSRFGSSTRIRASPRSSTSTSPASLGLRTREEEAARFAPLLAARVRDLFLHPAVFMDAKDTIADAGARMKAANCHALLVREGDEAGIVTRTDLLNAAVLDRRSIESPIGPLARRPIVSVAPDDLRLDRLAHDDEAQQAAGGGLSRTANSSGCSKTSIF